MTIVPCSSSPPERLDQTRPSAQLPPFSSVPTIELPSRSRATPTESPARGKLSAFGELQRHSVRSRARASTGERIESGVYLRDLESV